MKNSIMRSVLGLALLLAVSLACFVRDAHSSGLARAINGTGMDHVAVAYTQPNFQGLAWKIPRAGNYDLGGSFELPNDSIVSIGVAPGYSVTLYQNEGFAGRRMTVQGDTPDLGKQSYWASSLKVQKKSMMGPRAVAEWRRFHDENKNEPFFADPGVARVAKSIEVHGKEIALFQRAEVDTWYGVTSDRQRVVMSDALLKIFSDCGVDVYRWEPDTFAQMMNNYFDWSCELSVWGMACLILNVDPEPFNVEE
jgi:hypothetical protein